MSIYISGVYNGETLNNTPNIIRFGLYSVDEYGRMYYIKHIKHVHDEYKYTVHNIILTDEGAELSVSMTE